MNTCYQINYDQEESGEIIVAKIAQERASNQPEKIQQKIIKKEGPKRNSPKATKETWKDT